MISDLFFWRKKEHVHREIFAILAKAQKGGVLDDASRKMIENILDFATILVREIMTPRTDIVAVSSSDNLEDLIQVFTESHYTHIPVYRESIDNIIGILNVQDLLKECSKNNTNVDILTHLTKPYYIPETKNAHLLFDEFKNNKKHIAIVIDEYGGTSGLITLEDLLEEIVGDIRDEYEQCTNSEDIVRTVDGAIIADGRTEIEKIEERLEMNLQRGRYETVSGLILNTIRRIPHPGENFQIEGMNITIENADERSIKKVKLKRLDNESLNEE